MEALILSDLISCHKASIKFQGCFRSLTKAIKLLSNCGTDADLTDAHFGILSISNGMCF